MSIGMAINVGFSVSVTVIVKEAVVVFPLSSVARKLTTVSPMGNIVPLMKSLVRPGTPQLSLAVGSIQFTTAPQDPRSFSTFISMGIPEITGLSLSSTDTVNELVEVFPA